MGKYKVRLKTGELRHIVKNIRSPPTKKRTKKELVNVELFWQHYDKGKKKYQTVCLDRGGGQRRKQID